MERDQTQAQAPAQGGGGEQEAPHDRQRESLHGLLRSLDFLHGAEALKPPGDDGAPGKPKVEPGLLARLMTLVPTALGELTGDPPATAAGAPKAEKPDAASKESDEAAQAVAALAPAEAEDEAGEVEAEEEHAGGDAGHVAVQQKKAAHHAAPAHHGPDHHAPAQHGAPTKQSGKHAAPHHAAHVKAAEAAPLEETTPAPTPTPAQLLPLNAAKRALAWSKRQGFGRSPFLIRRTTPSTAPRCSTRGCRPATAPAAGTWPAPGRSTSC